VKRAVANANKDMLIDGPLLDITAISFEMREWVYPIAQTKASRNKNVIVTFSVERF